MKRAKMRLVAVYIDCPHCGEGSDNPVNGSLMWEPGQVAKHGDEYCIHCDELFAFPSWVEAKASWPLQTKIRG